MMRTQTIIDTKAFALRAVAVLALVAFALCMTARFQTADAAEMLNADQKGSLTISPVNTDNKSVSGTFEIYKVATAVTDGTGWHFEWAKGYEGTDHALYDKTGKLSAAYTKQLVSLLKSKVKNQKPTQKSASNAATTTFSNLSVGLYYVKMTNVQKGYDTISPFLVSIPTSDADGNLTYNVTANTKAGKAEKESSSTTSSTTGSSSGSSSTETLPQTGQLWWPVFVLIAAGAAFLLAGVARRHSGKNDAAR
jgi:hypothetical protein